MERNTIETTYCKEDAGARNSVVAHEVISSCLQAGISEYCLCTGARNSAIIDCLEHVEGIKTFFFYDERCAAFFALGRSRATQHPVVVITTSGTAVGELLPTVMEAYYSGVPLLVISADRPRCFRGSGAPQAAEQVGIFGLYTPFIRDIEIGENPSLVEWDKKTAAQLNVCFEEAYRHSFDELPDFPPVNISPTAHEAIDNFDAENFRIFMESCNHPIAIVSTLLPKDREGVLQFLSESNIPAYCEGPSGIRESTLIDKQRLLNVDNLWNRAEICGYPIDGILRIGGVPTTRLWRDLEKKEGQIRVCSISHLPFPGLSWNDVVHTDVTKYLSASYTTKNASSALIESDRIYYDRLQQLLAKHERSEPSIIKFLSDVIPDRSLVYLGNSMPIRQWDLAATFQQKYFTIEASRGLNGIDGQLSTFLGLSDPDKSNWAIVGDLTALYDLSAPWVLRQLQAQNIQIVVINNGGGKIFSRLFTNEKLQNNHDYRLKSMAELWGMEYLLYEGHADIPLSAKGPRLIECIPDAIETEQFWSDYKNI
jgi:2-succinyl-5-enolpyruvyl-6-hydroxy-3-cyclohexene-1-carboxylate synthase